MESSGVRHHCYHTLHPVGEHKYTLIWLHGLTHDASFFLKEFLDPKMKVIPENCKVIMPTAPLRQVTGLEGKTVHSWFNFYTWNTEYPSLEEFYANYNQEDID